MAAAEKTGVLRVTSNTPQAPGFRRAERALQCRPPGAESCTVSHSRCATGSSHSSWLARFACIQTRISGSKLALLSQVESMPLPGNAVAPSCLTHGSMHLKHLLNTLRGLDGNLIFLAKQRYVLQAHGMTWLILPLHASAV